MQVIFAGTNGWYDTATGNTTCALLKTGEHSIILDAGNGFHKISGYLSERKRHTAYLFLSHFHLDHIVGLHTLNRMRSLERLFIIGPAGTADLLGTVINSPFTVPFEEQPFEVRLFELPADEPELPFSVESAPLLHSTTTLGYRIRVGGKTVTYCTDTGYCDNAVKLARDADLLIAECAYKTGQSNPGWPHLNPETAARIAMESGAKRLALVHFDASIYKSMEERRDAQRHAQVIFTNTFAARDGMRVEV